MKRILAVLLALALMLTLTPAALADESASATDPVAPAAQPGTLAHTISLLIERIRVLLTPDLAAKAELLAQQAERRIAELELLRPDQTELATALTDGYLHRLQHAVEYMVRAQARGKNISKAEAKLLQAAEGGKVLAADLKGTLPDEDLAELLDEADRAALNAACIAGVAPEVVAALRDQGMGYGQIALIDILAKESGKTVDEITTLFNAKGFGATAAELGLSVKDLHGQAKQAHADTHQQSHDAGEQHPAQHSSSGSGHGHGKGGGKGTR